MLTHFRQNFTEIGRNFVRNSADRLGRRNVQNCTKIVAKIERVKTVRAVSLAMQVMTDALYEDLVEKAIAERLGITALLTAKRLELKAEKTILTAWLNRGRGELTAEAY